MPSWSVLIARLTVLQTLMDWGHDGKSANSRHLNTNPPRWRVWYWSLTSLNMTLMINMHNNYTSTSSMCDTRKHSKWCQQACSCLWLMTMLHWNIKIAAGRFVWHFGDAARLLLQQMKSLNMRTQLSITNSQWQSQWYRDECTNYLVNQTVPVISATAWRGCVESCLFVC